MDMIKICKPALFMKSENILIRPFFRDYTKKAINVIYFFEFS